MTSKADMTPGILQMGLAGILRKTFTERLRDGACSSHLRSCTKCTLSVNGVTYTGLAKDCALYDLLKGYLN